MALPGSDSEVSEDGGKTTSRPDSPIPAPADLEAAYADAAGATDAAALAALLADAPSGLPNYVSRERGKSLLHLAARAGEVEKVRLLLARGAKLGVKVGADVRSPRPVGLPYWVWSPIRLPLARRRTG